ncbi:BC1881 family protein [Alicyclobacillus fastidiosus]|uniref:BC1881 family protein n=1 Tax=Alicyclobacillus fastidiosus TaxID=392011 RepID=A0ABV5AK61_9BACL|nr:BC1881 family protein [Alicyclobacillus fastidiosus]WEH09280.1 BC1881 family protein [Alicyclobacillus fastidiosus]
MQHQPMRRAVPDTMQLQHELSQREGVSTYQVPPHETYIIQIGAETIQGTGPAIVTVNID